MSFPRKPLQRIWNLRTDASPADAARLASQLGVSDLMVALLATRGLHTAEEMDVFLNPQLRHLAPPTAYPGATQAAEALAQGLTEGRTLAVWGDYDVDGVTGTALVTSFLKDRGFSCRHYIPNRLEEGYGLNAAGIEALAEQGVSLLFTVDCGITDVAEIARARELGMNVVISDHHLPGTTLPEALAVCNPRLGDCPCASLAGVGVAFFVMAALNRLLPGDPVDMRRYLDLVAMGTLADVVELDLQNRVLVKNGMLLIDEASRPGIFALKEAAGFNPSARLGAGKIVFGLAPRINAAGRFGRADLALDLLLAPDRATARPLAEQLDRLNVERKGEEERISGIALEQAASQGGRMGLVVAGDDWHSGVVGIVASRVQEAHYRPALVLTLENGRYKGSGRSIPEVDIHAAITSFSDLLVEFGGHRQAAGLTFEREHLEEVRRRFDAHVREQIGEETPLPRLPLDLELPFGLLTHRLLKELDMLQPFGQGNPEPLFRSPIVEVRAHRIFGKNHVALDLREPETGITFKAKAWRQAETIPAHITGGRIAVAFTPKINSWNGVDSIEMFIKDWKKIAPAPRA